MHGLLDATLSPLATLSTPQMVLLALALLIALGFEFVNGFHDTANAVATVIYTKSLRPWTAVIWSGLCNFLGVFAGGIAVAVSIIKLLPNELLTSGSPAASLSMVMALLLAAVLWNLGTWYLGLPASSSHTLIGAILGVGVAHSLLPGHAFGAGVNWGKATDVFVSLLVSPLFGFSVAAGMLWLLLKLVPRRELHRPPEGDAPPPLAVRSMLVATCTGVSFAHGSNDGQKGVGLIMLILIGLLPASFSLDTRAAPAQLERVAQATVRVEQLMAQVGHGAVMVAAAGEDLQLPAGPQNAQLGQDLAFIRESLAGHASVEEVPAGTRFEVRKRILAVDQAMGKLLKDESVPLAEAQRAQLKSLRADLRSLIDFAPTWVLVAVALALGVGTMVGWKRIVVTVGEKIGKSHLTYSQGAAAELVAASTIGFAAVAGLPVSTTHVLSSGIAGTMVMQGSGLQGRTVRNIALAWLFTLPASAALSGGLFLIFHFLFA